MKDTIYSGEYQIISKIGTEGTNSTACREFIELVKIKKRKKELL